MTPLSAPPDSFVTKRNEAYAALFIPESLEELLAVFSDDVVYSDFSWEALNMDKNALAPFYKVSHHRSLLLSAPQLKPTPRLLDRTLICFQSTCST